ncbi:MAG: HlyD family efflux transporter periplasmic adaptor subunit [Oscillospiraceae bacterium]|nr:HlyD family efflux transporter periplasmic adaptor subunit [Oscillospiraceae bacterium]MDD4412931.1 HlyD family efflux transporter periplasmic adaptor subunit [Oscillospiraceae bacterium]
MDTFIKRIITLCISLFLIAYVGYQAFQVLYNPVKTETVYSASVYDTLDTEGITVRNEKPITGEKNGYLFYTVENGSRVSKNGTIAKVYPTQADSRSQKQLDRLTEEIEQLKDIQSQGTAGRVNLDVIDKQISQTVIELAAGVNTPTLKNMDLWQSRLLALLNKRQVTVGKTVSFESRINSLTELKNQLVTSYSVATSSIKSPVAGYFVSKIDGFENTIDYNKVKSLTVKQLDNLMNSTPKAPNSDLIGKVVGDYKWYLACVLSAADAGKVRQGTTPDILLPFISDEIIPTEVVAANRDPSGNVAVIFECSYMSSELSSIRRESVQIRLKRYEGLRVSSDSIITNDKGEQGVYVISGDTVVFRKVEILHALPDYVICKETDKNGYLELYDDIVVEGKGLYDGKMVR